MFARAAPLEDAPMTYSHILSDIYADPIVRKAPRIAPGIYLTSGELINVPVPSPLVWEVNSTAAKPPPHFESADGPLASRQFVQALESLGVSNLQKFPALLRNSKTGEEWDQYFGINIVGLIACARAESTGTEIAKRASGDLSLHVFQELAIDPKKARGALLFRLAEQPSIVLCADSLLDELRRIAPAGGWGISIHDVRNI
jgi:hypothetical protein